MIKQKNMSCILHIETSTDACSVAVSQDGAVIFHVEDFEGPSHAQKLGTFVDEALSFTDNHAIPFDAVAVSQGPGSYTGLRTFGVADVESHVCASAFRTGIARGCIVVPDDRCSPHGGLCSRL